MLATIGNLQIQLPVAAASLTAIGFHGTSDGSLSLQPVGRQANEGILARLWRRIAGARRDTPRWYQLEGGPPGTNVLDVGTAPGYGRLRAGGRLGRRGAEARRGRQTGREPHRPAAVKSPSVMVSVMNVRPDPAIAVGTPVLAASSKLGTAATSPPWRSRRWPRTRRTAGTTSRSPSIPHPARSPSLARAHPLRRRRRRTARPRRGRGLLPGLREQLEVDACVVNGENIANGIGITPRLADRLLAAGADASHSATTPGDARRSGPISLRRRPSSARRTSRPARPGEG